MRVLLSALALACATLAAPTQALAFDAAAPQHACDNRAGLGVAASQLCAYLLPSDSATQSNIYGAARGGTLLQWRDGSSSEPARETPATMWVERYFTGDRKGGVAYDSGAAYLQAQKVGGTLHGVTLTASARHMGGTGSSIAFQGRAAGYDSDASLFGGWFYTFAPTPIKDMAGIEINLNNRGRDIGWVEGGFPKGIASGLIVATADKSSTPSTQGIYVAAQRNKGARGWYTGMFVHGDAVERTNATGNGEVFRVHGATERDDAYKVFRARLGYFVSGLETFGATFFRGILEMARGQYLAWGGSDTESGSARLTVNSVNALDFSGSGLQLAPQQQQPSQPREGLIVYTDGTNWNPGEGPGFYGYTQGRWIKFGS